MQLNLTLDFSSGKEPTCQCRRCRLDRTLSQEDSLEEDMAAYSSILDWKDLMDKGAWQAAVHGVSKSQTRPSNWVHMHVISQNLCLFFFFVFLCVCVPCISFLSGRAYVFLLLCLLPFVLISFSLSLSLLFPRHSLPSILISFTWTEIDLLNLVMFPVLNFRNKWF